jgi:hypothetical protein
LTNNQIIADSLEIDFNNFNLVDFINQHHILNHVYNLEFLSEGGEKKVYLVKNDDKNLILFNCTNEIEFIKKLTES